MNQQLPLVHPESTLPTPGIAGLVLPREIAVRPGTLPAAPPAPAPRRVGQAVEFELKFVIPNGLAAAVASWMQSHLQAHREFPSATISSIYYDTADFEMLRAKVHSDYLKRKVRLRWYRGLDGAATAQTTFMEAKFRTGSRREKIRVKTPLAARAVSAGRLDAGVFCEPLELLREHGVSDVARLFPAFQIDYRRLRFTHPFSACTFCLDRDIAPPRVHPRRFAHAVPVPLGLAVLEQKGPLDQLDSVVAGLMRFGLRKSSFSKYERCHRRLIEI